ncbi:MAG TPA: magnesium transporter [Cyclobacteriaceae bacterium]|nr:magnesium transporter [Cyclobacteriaceae bacterium]HMV91342.1 magnesium transporter [Cyclobacteriaceae bacterium]HMX00154.1 magnesium transporter [Cyclobacteriaceae bacterium]HMX52220.1 magnesium transporter [Cyclobacteriaceae bacterium]HMY92974.1 magnesium transporter [Cyclobacteriaceae bacterium]
MEELIQFELSKEFVERFQRALDERDQTFILQVLEDVNPADISALLYEFNSEESKYVMDMLPLEIQAEIVRDLDPVTRVNFLKVYESAQIITLVNLLNSDDAADILNELPIKIREEVLHGLDPDLRIQVIDLLRYEENVAGGLMAKELIKVRDHWTVVQCIDEIRKQAENVDKFYAVYVVDDHDKLLGRVSLKDLVISDARKIVSEIIEEEEIVSVETYLDDTEVADIMRKYDLESVPVVNVQGQLVGRITIDDVVDVITEQAEEDRQLMSGISEDLEEDDSVWKNTRARLPWLLIGIVGGLLNAKFMGLFKDEIVQIAAIAFFTPLIQATGGNVGIQSSSLIVQSLANPGFVEEGLWQRLTKVFVVALANGLFLSVIVLGANLFLFDHQALSFIVSIALFSVVVFASFIGTVTPLILNRFGFNPALASGPFITTTNDLLGLTIYFLTVHLLL